MAPRFPTLHPDALPSVDAIPGRILLVHDGERDRYSEVRVVRAAERPGYPSLPVLEVYGDPRAAAPVLFSGPHAHPFRVVAVLPAGPLREPRADVSETEAAELVAGGAPAWPRRTPEEVRALCESWDGDWTLEDTEGFEAHREELRAFAEAKSAEWARQARDRQEARELAERMRLESIAGARGFFSSEADGASEAHAAGMRAAALVDVLERLARAVERVGDLMENSR